MTMWKLSYRMDWYLVNQGSISQGAHFENVQFTNKEFLFSRHFFPVEQRRVVFLIETISSVSQLHPDNHHQNSGVEKNYGYNIS